MLITQGGRMSLGLSQKEEAVKHYCFQTTVYPCLPYEYARLLLHM